MKNLIFIFRILFLAIILFSIAFPPFFAIDTKSNGKIHTSMGYYPIWNQPTSKDAYYSLVNNKIIEPIVFENYSGNSGIEQYRSNLNTVQLITNSIFTAAAYLILIFVLKRSRRR